MKRFLRRGVSGRFLSFRRQSLALMASVGVATLACSSALAGTTTYSSPGNFSYTVPGGVSQLQLDVAGAGGGGGGADGKFGGNGGNGDSISATLDVSPGDTIYFTFGTQSNLASAPAAISTTIVNTPAPASPTAINVTTNGTQVQLT